MYLGKRLVDFCISLIISPLALLLVLLFGFLLFLLSGKSPIFLQKRPGHNEELFVMYKLRTLFPDQDKAKPCNQLGKLLRNFSIDELPQLVNVMKGEMSIVGPRPLLPEYLSLYNEKQRKRHSVLPGITGWAQINGRNQLDWPERFDLDLWYIKHQSLRLDLKIIMSSLIKIFRFADVKAEGLSEVEKFKGDVFKKKD